ncbi:MAG: heavy metal-binding domain-containing protein [archaeon]
MKKGIILSIAIIALVFTNCARSSKTEQKTGVSDTTMQSNDSTHHQMAMPMYQCPMHHEVTSDKPGTCPKCGMNLEKIEKN